jgi:hypothetical protein
MKGARERARKAFLESIPFFSDSGDLRLPENSFAIRSSALSDPPETSREIKDEGN